MKPGDRVAYSARFLRSIGGDFATAERRGELKTIEGGDTGFVLWDDLHSLQRVLLVNIAKVGSIRFSDPHARKEPY